MHPFNYPYAIPLSFDDIEPYRTRNLQTASTQKYSMPKTYDTGTETWILLEQGPAMNNFPPFNHFAATLRQQGIRLKTPDAYFHQLNSNHQPVKSLAQAQAQAIKTAPTGMSPRNTYEQTKYSTAARATSAYNQQQPSLFFIDPSGATDNCIDAKTAGLPPSKSNQKMQRMAKHPNQRQVYVPRACKSRKAAHMDLKSVSKLSHTHTTPKSKQKQDVNLRPAPITEAWCGNNSTRKYGTEADQNSHHNGPYVESASENYGNGDDFPVNAHRSHPRKIVAYQPPPPPPPRYDSCLTSPRQYSFLESPSGK